MATAKVPERVTAPEVAVLGVNPVVPAENVVPAAGVVEVQAEPFEVNTLPLEPGATKVTLDVPLPINTLFAVSVVSPVPPEATGRVPVTLVCKFAYVVEVEPVPPEAIGNAEPRVHELK